MLRFVPKGYYHFVQAESLGAIYDDGKVDVAIFLANFGIGAGSVAKLSKHDIGQSAVNSLRGYGVGVSKITYGDNRVGICFLERDASQRPSEVIYDRVGSATATTQSSDFNQDGIFEGVDWFHFTGITPAISGSAAAICFEACRVARRHNITVGCDLNHCKNLWSHGGTSQVIGGLMEYVNVCISNEEDASDVFGVRVANTDITGGKINHEGYKEVVKKLADTFHSDKATITLRSPISASDNNWVAMLYDGSDYYFNKNYLIRIVDRTGDGDSFGDGLIYSLLSSYAPQDAIEFVVAASCLEHSIGGGFS